MAFQPDVIGLVSHSKLLEAGLEQKRVDVTHRLDERISKLHGFASTCKTFPQIEPQHKLGGHRHEISNTASLFATTYATTVQTPHTVKRPEQFSNQINDRTHGTRHDILRLCGSGWLDAPSTQIGRDILRPCGSISWLNTPRTEVDSDSLLSCGSIPPWNTLRQQAKPHGASTKHNVLYGHGVETIHESTQKSTVAGKHRRDLEFHIRKIHEIEQRGSSLSETSTIDILPVHDAHSIHLESHADNLDLNRSIKCNNSTDSSQSPHSVLEHPNSALSRMQEEEIMACDVDVTQIVHQSNVACECNLTHECNLTCERNLHEELVAAQLKVAELRLEVHATLRDLDVERERAVSREQELTREVGRLRMEDVRMQANCTDCKNCQLQIGDLETTLAEATREHSLGVEDCTELGNLRLQLAHEIEQCTLHERACNAANDDKVDYMLKFEKLNTEYRKLQASFVELEKINVGLELQSASNAEVDKQRQNMCDNQSALLRRLEAELQQTQRDLVIEREFVVRLLLQIQQLQLEVTREKEHLSS